MDAGYPEDAATGVAAAALAAYLASHTANSGSSWRRVEIEQGDTMARPNLLHASALADSGGVHRTTVTGQAILRGWQDIDIQTIDGAASADTTAAGGSSTG